MTIQELITLLENKLNFTQSQSAGAKQRGDIAALEQLTIEIANTQTTLEQLKTLI